MQQLFEFINQINGINETIEEELSLISEFRYIPKGYSIISSGKRCEELFFIQKGLVKLQFDSDDTEFIMRFFQENLLFSDLESLNNNKWSGYKAIALEDTSIIAINYNKFDLLCQKHHALETFYRKFLTMAHLNMMVRIKEMLEDDAKKRYDNFVEQYPNLAQRIHLGDIAKYIGITQVSLSRIRSQR